MKKRNCVYYILIIWLALPSFISAQSLKDYQAAFNGSLKAWAQTFSNFKLSAFKQVGPPHLFDNTHKIITKNKQAFYPNYKQALSTSPNGRFTLDMYSYLLLQKRRGKFISNGSDVEQSLLLGNIPESKWQQIAYYGYTQRVQEIYWVNNNTFILTAVRLDAADRNLPVIIIGHLKEQTLTSFETTNTDCYQKPGGYTSPKLIPLHINSVD